MSLPNFFGRRIQIAGSIADSPEVAAAETVAQARDLIERLVKALLRGGANFVIPVDAEPARTQDGQPICFDWLVWRTIKDNLALRPPSTPGQLAVAVLHHKTEDQIPEQFAELWDEMKGSSHVKIENAARWNMNSKRMEAQARFGDVLIAIGGGEGVLYLANLYHEAGKPVVPLNLPLCRNDTGALHLYNYGLVSHQSRHLFQLEGGDDAHTWINRLRFSDRHSTDDRVSTILDLLDKLEKPEAFGVRLLNPSHVDYVDVQNYFDTIVQPVVELEYGYKLNVIDGVQPFEHARIDQEIFAKLHRSAVVLADTTGGRPNCFLELGYALGRGLPTMAMAKKGSSPPFDLNSYAALHWSTDGTADERKRIFREHWEAIRNRPPIVPRKALIG